MRRSPGISLVETVVAIFVMLTSFLLITNLFQSSLRYESQISMQVAATHVADQTLRQMATYGSQYSQFAQMGASVYNVSAPYVADSGPYHIVAISSPPIQQASPSLGLEAVFIGPPDNRKIMNNTTKSVQVNVTWDPLRPSQNVVLVTQLSEPSRAATGAPSIVISGPANPTLAENAIVNYTAQLMDSTNTPISDVMLEWNVVPINGSATIVSQPRNGSLASLENKIVKANGSVTYNPGGGQCYLNVTCNYEGITYTSNTTYVNLSP